MNFWKKIGIGILALILLFGVYYGSYQFYLYQYGNADKQKYAKQLPEKAVEVNRAEENKITQRTKLVIEHYNRRDNSTQEEQAVMPVEYIGMKREELAQYLADYASNPQLRDVESGFEKYQILSFSSKEVVLRKIYIPAGTEYKYYLVEENGCVTVYYIDQKTVYEYTNILVEMLPEDVREQVQRGKYITDEDSLYDFLETYTS